MESESTGEMYISHNPEAIELAQLKAEQAKHEKWFHSTLPCKPCYQTGVTQDRYGRDTTCPHCSGKGRVNRGYWNQEKIMNAPVQKKAPKKNKKKQKPVKFEWCFCCKDLMQVSNDGQCTVCYSYIVM